MFTTQTFISLAVLVLSFVLTAVISHFLIPVLASKKMGQKILEIGPRWHKSKEGTPTMGGLAFLATTAVIGIALCIYIAVSEGTKEMAPFLMTVALALASGLIGIVDDSAKLRKAQNEGLTAAQKFLLQLLIGGLYLLGMRLFGGLTTALYIPFFGVSLELGVFYYVVALLLIVGIMNAVNLTGEAVNAPLSYAAALMMGLCAGFLVYNFYPARVFMGDTGSLLPADIRAYKAP